MENNKPLLLKLKAYSIDTLGSTMLLSGTKKKTRIVVTMTSTTVVSSHKAKLTVFSTTREINKTKDWWYPQQAQILEALWLTKLDLKMMRK
jgi:hypothetical protein